MRVNKKGEAVCEKGEVRVGNFFVKVEGSGMVKLTELSSMMVHRISADLPIGVLLVSAVDSAMKKDEQAADFLQLYCSMMWLCSTVVPVTRKNEAGEVEYNFWEEFLGVINRAADEAKMVYGVKAEPSDEEDAEALEGVKDALAVEEEIKQMEVEG